MENIKAINGIESSTPKDTLIKARENKWLSDSDIWVQMLRDRNETSHVYNETKAREIYQHVHDYFPELKRVFLALKEKFSKD